MVWSPSITESDFGLVAVCVLMGRLNREAILPPLGGLRNPAFPCSFPHGEIPLRLVERRHRKAGEEVARTCKRAALLLSQVRASDQHFQGPLQTAQVPRRSTLSRLKRKAGRDEMSGASNHTLKTGE